MTKRLMILPVMVLALGVPFSAQAKYMFCQGVLIGARTSVGHKTGRAISNVLYVTSGVSSRQAKREFISAFSDEMPSPWRFANTNFTECRKYKSKSAARKARDRAIRETRGKNRALFKMDFELDD